MNDIFSIKFKVNIFIEIIADHLFGFLKKDNEDFKYVFPKKILDYKFIKEFKSQELAVTCFKIGLYQNQEGKKALAKIYNRNIKNKEYYWLINEIRIYSGLNYLYDKYGKEIQASFPDIGVPRIMHFEIKRKATLILIEFLEGEIVGNFSLKERVAIIGRILDYFHFLGKYSDDKGFRKFFIKRNNLFFLIIINIYTFKAIIKNLLFLPKIIKAYLYFILNYFSLLDPSYFQISHRDLNLKNVLFDREKNKISIIDFGLAIYSNKFWDTVIANKYMYYSSGALLETCEINLMTNILMNGKFFKNYKILSVYSAIYDLSFCPKQYRQLAYNYLIHILNLKI